MKLLDLFCGAGGAAKGYHDAGFEITGVDIKPQPNYPYKFIQADALEYSLEDYDAIHASPPCQFATAYKRNRGHVKPAINLIPQTRERLRQAGVPYVIENVEGARDHLLSPIMLCGSSFGLDIRRHRLFETNFLVPGVPCDHKWQTPRFPSPKNRENLRCTVEIGVWRIPKEQQRRAMQIDWMSIPELSQAIPPAYTWYIGTHLKSYIK